MYTAQRAVMAELYSEEAYAAAQFRMDTRGGVNSKDEEEEEDRLSFFPAYERSFPTKEHIEPPG